MVRAVVASSVRAHRIVHRRFAEAGSASVTEDHARRVDYPRAASAWTLVAVFFLASVVSVIDRGILALVIDPVRHDLAISDTQISLLQGLSFGLFYAGVGLPLGLLADRLQRRLVIIAGVSIWSLATILGAFAPSYGWMFASRLLVGLGEATLAPCAVSMISDMFPPAKRGRPLGVYIMGQAVSAGLAVMLTGYVLAAAPRGVFDFLPGAAGLAPWRITFLLAGLSGVLVIALLAPLREPVRRGVLIGAGRGAGLATTFRYLRANAGVFVPLYLAFATVALTAYGTGAWNAAMFMRQFLMTPGTVGGALGPAGVVAGVLGTTMAGFAIDRMARRRTADGKLAMLVVLPLLALPSMFATFAPTGLTAVLVTAEFIMIFPMIGTTMIAAVQEMVPNDMRGVAVSLFSLTNTIIGAVCGPLLIATLTQHVFKDSRSVGLSITCVGAPALIIASGMYAISWSGLKKSLGRKSDLRRVMRSEAP